MSDESKGFEPHPRVSPVQVEGGADDDGGGLDFFRLWAVVLEDKWIIAAVIALAVLGANAYLYLAPPIYNADALIQIEGGKKEMPGVEEMAALYEDMASVNAEIEILQSRMVLGRVVDKLHLDVVASPRFWRSFGAAVARRYAGPTDSYGEPWFNLTEYAWGGERIKVESLTVPPAMIGAWLTLIMEAEGRYRLLDAANEQLLEGEVGKRARREWPNGESLELFVSQLKGRPGTRFDVVRTSRLAAIGTVKSSLKVKEKGRQSEVLELNLRSPDPELDVEILNEIANAYLRQNVERKSEEAEKRLQFVQRQLPTMKDQLEAAEQAFNSYRKQAGSVDLQAETQALLDQIVDIESELRKREMQRDEFLQRFMPSHPIIQGVDLQIRQTQATLDDLNKRVATLPDSQQEVLRFNRDVQVNTELYMTLLNSEQGFRVAKAGTVGTVRILDHAVAPPVQVEPNVSRIRLLSVFGGLFGGLGLVFLRRALHRGVEDPDQVEETLALPVYATVPHSEEQKKATGSRWWSRTKKRSTRKKAVLLALTNKDDLVVESLRSLRTTLNFAMLEARSNSVLFTGPAPGVGKSFVSVNFAVVLAQAGKKVLLVDADLRKGHLHLPFGLSRERGLSEYIGEGLELDAVTHRTTVENLYFIPTGVLPPNPSELLMRDRFPELLKQAEGSYDLVLLDSPPVLAATDAVIIGQHAGATLMVIRAGEHPMRQLKDTVKRLRQGGTNLRGVVFNDMPLAPSRYGYGYGYGYGYRKYAYRYSYKDK